MAEIQIVDLKEDSCRFLLSDASESLANSIRRAMISRVPTMAVDFIDIYMNTSSMYDEVLAHRIGQIPLKTDLEKYNLREECVCKGEGCPSCQVSLRLNVEGPRIVYSGDFISDDPDVVPAYDNIPIVKLKEGQQLMLEATARLGFGKEHSKFQPVVACGYRIVPEITIAENCTSCMECVRSCPRNVFSSDDGKVSVKNILECSLCMECVKVCEEDAVKINEDTGKFVFYFEVDGSMSPETVLREALNFLKSRFTELAEMVEDLS